MVSTALASTVSTAVDTEHRGKTSSRYGYLVTPTRTLREPQKLVPSKTYSPTRQSVLMDMLIQAGTAKCVDVPLPQQTCSEFLTSLQVLLIWS